jgi:hypothetical protein
MLKKYKKGIKVRRRRKLGRIFSILYNWSLEKVKDHRR